MENLNLPEERVLIVDPCDKALFSHPGAVLVDDWLEHRAPWEERGGIFIHYRSAKESIAALEGALLHLACSGAQPPFWPEPQAGPAEVAPAPAAPAPAATATAEEAFEVKAEAGRAPLAILPTGGQSS